MFKMPLFASAIALSTAVIAQTPAPPRPVPLPGVSPAGIAVLNKMRGKTDPAAVALVQRQRAIQQESVGVLNAPALDVDKLALAMRHGRELEGQMRALADSHLIEMVRALPEADRKPFLRAVIGRQAPAAPAAK